MTNIKNGSQKTILVIEDNRTQALHLQAMLERKGLRVVWVDNGAQGVERAQALHPDLILLDVQMPGMNGLEVSRRLKGASNTADIPIVMLTRHDDADTVMSGLETGVVDYIPKDAFAEVVLIETLRQMGLVA